MMAPSTAAEAHQESRSWPRLSWLASQLRRASCRGSPASQLQWKSSWLLAWLASASHRVSPGGGCCSGSSAVLAIVSSAAALSIATRVRRVRSRSVADIAKLVLGRVERGRLLRRVRESRSSIERIMCRCRWKAFLDSVTHQDTKLSFTACPPGGGTLVRRRRWKCGCRGKRQVEEGRGRQGGVDEVLVDSAASAH